MQCICLFIRLFYYILNGQYQTTAAVFRLAIKRHMNPSVVFDSLYAIVMYTLCDVNVCVFWSETYVSLVDNFVFRIL